MSRARPQTSVRTEYSPLLRALVLFGVALQPLLFLPGLLEDAYLLPKDAFFRWLALIIFPAALVVGLPSWSESRPKRGPAEFRLEASWPVVGLAVMLLASLPATLLAVNRVDALLEWSDWLLAGVAVLLVPVLFRTATQQRPLLWGLAASGLVVSGLGLAQFANIGGGFRNSAQFDPISTLGHRNFAAEALFLFLPAAAVLLLRGNARWERLLGGASLGLGLPHLLLSQCRGAWVGHACAGLLVGAAWLLRGERPGWTRREQIGLGVLAGLALAALVGVASIYPLRERVTSIFDLSGGTNQFRLLTWAGTLRMIAEHPLLGVGHEHFKVYYPLYRSPVEAEFHSVHHYVNQAHNEPLQILAEAGIPGGLGFLLALLAVLVIGVRNMVRAPEGEARHLSAAWLWSCAGVIGSALFAFPLRNPVPGWGFWILTGMLVALRREIDGSEPKLVLKLRQSSVWLMAGVLAVLLLVLGVVSVRQLGQGREMLLGRIERDRTNWPASVYHLERAARWWPYDFEVYYQLAFALGQANRVPEAEAATRACLALHPNFRNAWFNLGPLAESRGDNAAAILAYEKTLEIDPNFVSALNNRMVLALGAGDLNAALEYAARALRSEPHNPDAAVNLGVVYFQRREMDLATQTLQQALDERSRVHFTPADINYFSTAGTILVRVRPIGVTGQPQSNWSSQGRFRVSNSPQAEQLLDNPGQGWELVLDRERHRFYLQFSVGDPLPHGWEIEYTVLGKSSVFQLRRNELVYAKAANNLGKVLESEQKYEQSELYYRMAAELQPNYASPLTNMVQLQVNILQRPERAVPALRRLVPLLGNSPKAQEYKELLRQLEAPAGSPTSGGEGP